MARAKINNVGDLESAVKYAAEGAKAKRRGRYMLARELGFKASEASYLQNRQEITIRKLAEERRLQNGGK